MVHGSIATRNTALAEKKKERTKASRTTTNGNLTDLDPGLVTKDWNRATLARKLTKRAGNYGSRTDSAPNHSQETTGTHDAIQIVLSAYRVVH
jgi:hypothetical protein